MKQMAMDGGPPFLSEEVIIDILKWLPVKSLLRFRCVCKHWNNLLRTQFFIAAHLQNSPYHNPLLLTARLDDKGYFRFDLLNRRMQLLEVRNSPVIQLHQPEIVGCCDGVVCFAVGPSHLSAPSLILWNPATTEVRHVLPRTHTSPHGFICNIAFGFSPIANDYKIVVNYGSFLASRLSPLAEVYSSSTGLWKEIEIGNLGRCFLHQTKSTTVNGVMFWPGYEKDKDEGAGKSFTGVIVSFDLATEVFTPIPMPPSDKSYLATRLAVHENKLALVVSKEITNSESFSVDVWVLNEDRDAKREMWNWTKKYASKAYPCWLSPVTIWRSEIVCHDFVGHEPIDETNPQEENDEPTTVLYLFNVTTNECRMFPMGGFFQNEDHADEFFNYFESLVPLGNSSIEEL